MTVGDSSYPVSRYCLPAGAVGSFALAVPLTSGPSALTLPCPDAGLSPVPRSCDDCTDGACTGDACATRSADGVCIDANGAASQACCASEPTRPCFRTDVVERAGTAVVPTPLWPDVTYPKTASGAVLAGTFCAAATGAAQVDGGIGLPAPGAVLVPVGETWVQ